MRCLPLPLSLLALALASGCGPARGLDDGTASSDTSSTASTSTATTDPDSTTAGPTTSPSTTVASTTLATTGSTGDSSTGEPPSVCDPQPMIDIVAWVLVDGGEMPAEPSADPYLYDCTIANQGTGEVMLTIELACTDGPHTLEIGTSTGIWFDPGGDFVLSVLYSAATFRGTDMLVTLRRADGELVLAGATTPWRPGLDVMPADFFDPLEVTLLEDACPIEAPPDGNDFIEACYTLQRQALRFTLDGQSLDVYDHGADQLPPYILLVQYAQQLHDVTCTDISDRTYSWVAVPPILD